MKKELVAPIQEFTNVCGAIVNFRGYKTYGNNLFEVVESQLLSNLDVQCQMYFTSNCFIPQTLLDKTKQRITGTVKMKLLPSR